LSPKFVTFDILICISSLPIIFIIPAINIINDATIEIVYQAVFLALLFCVSCKSVAILFVYISFKMG
jgi:hypothetical protein